MDKILTVNDVAGILQVKAITVREMFREKRLRGFKVGKAWRTTEAMLQEDIDTLSRGESPPALPTPDAAPGSPIAVAKAPTTPPKSKEVVPAAPSPKKATEKAVPASEDETDDEDTQQMLF